MSFLPNHIHTEKTLDGVIVKYTFMRYSVPVMILKLPGDALKIKKQLSSISTVTRSVIFNDKFTSMLMINQS